MDPGNGMLKRVIAVEGEMIWYAHVHKTNSSHCSVTHFFVILVLGAIIDDM